jgi:hypothetical protein
LELLGEAKAPKAAPKQGNPKLIWMLENYILFL